MLKREASSENYGPRVYLYHIKNLKNTLLQFILFINQSTNIYISLMFVTQKGLTTPLTRRVARCCYLCAGDVYVVLLGSPTGSITLVSHMREIPIADVLRHPFLFGEKLT